MRICVPTFHISCPIRAKFTVRHLQVECLSISEFRFHSADKAILFMWVNEIAFRTFPKTKWQFIVKNAWVDSVHYVIKHSFCDLVYSVVVWWEYMACFCGTVTLMWLLSIRGEVEENCCGIINERGKSKCFAENTGLLFTVSHNCQVDCHERNQGLQGENSTTKLYQDLCIYQEVFLDVIGKTRVQRCSFNWYCSTIT
jgi:hypothetical protein